MQQILIRAVPKPMYEQIRHIAKKSGKSINSTILSMLGKVTGYCDGKDIQRDLSKYSGTWSQNDLKDFNKKTKIFKQIDDELWSK
jgi:hypothetical protein